MKNASGGRAAAKGLNEYARKAADIFYKTAGSVAETALKPLENYIDSAIGNSRKNLSYETKAEQIRDESGFGIKGSGAMEADILKYFIAKENAVRERFGRNGGSEKRLDEILAGIEFGYENSLKKMHKQMPFVVQEFLSPCEPSAAGKPFGAVYIPDTLFDEYQNIPLIPGSFLVPDSDAKFGGILKADIADNERKLGGAKPGGSLPDRFSVPDGHSKFGGVRKVQLDKVQYKRAVGGGTVGKPIDGAKTEEIGGMESHFYDGLYKVYDVFVDRPVGELLGGIEKLAKYASDKFKEHPYIYTAAVAVGLGGAAADAAFNNSKIIKSAADYAKNPGKIVVNAASFIGGVGELFKGNQPPVADLKIDTPMDNWTAGEKIVFNASDSYDTDGNITGYTWTFFEGGKVESKVTPTPVIEKTFGEGTAKITLNVKDDKGNVGAFGRLINVKHAAPKALTYDEIRESATDFLLDMNPQYEHKGIEFDGTTIFAPKEYRDTLIKMLAFYEKFSPVDNQFLKENNKVYIYSEIPDNYSIAGSRNGGVGFAKYVGNEYPQLKNVTVVDGNHNKLLIEVLAHEANENLVMRQESVGTVHSKQQQSIVDAHANQIASSAVSNLSKSYGKEITDEELKKWADEFDVDEYLKQKNAKEIIYS